MDPAVLAALKAGVSNLVSMINPIGAVKTVFVFACAHGLPDCDRQLQRCIGWTDMPRCYQENYGDIHTPEYRWAIENGQNIKVERHD